MIDRRRRLSILNVRSDIIDQQPDLWVEVPTQTCSEIPFFSSSNVFIIQINPSTLPCLKPGVCSGLILSGAFDPILKDGVWRRRSIKVLIQKNIVTERVGGSGNIDP